MTTISIPIKDPVTVKPNVLGGTPVIKGTRIPASLVFDLPQRGYTFELITKEYPSLTKKKLSAFFSLVSKSFDATQTKAV